MNLPEMNYGTYCPTCYQFVPEKFQPDKSVIREANTPFWRAFAEVYGLPLWMVRGWEIKKGISVLAGQVMANEMRRTWASNRGKGIKLNAATASRRQQRKRDAVRESA